MGMAMAMAARDFCYIRSSFPRQARRDLNGPAPKCFAGTAGTKYGLRFRTLVEVTVLTPRMIEGLYSYQIIACITEFPFFLTLQCRMKVGHPLSERERSLPIRCYRMRFSFQVAKLQVMWSSLRRTANNSNYAMRELELTQ